MKILAFETSCDDTAISIVKDGVEILGATRVSQTAHSEWGGVVPEIAARLHAENWRPVLNQCLHDAQLNLEEVDAIACTQGPGLQTSLLTGTTAAGFLSQMYEKPLIPVHHIHGHLCSVFLERKIEDVLFPNLVLTVSGGHTEMYLWENPTTFKKLGKTLDDACGEAFDKLAKMLELGYPGGPIVSGRAEKGDRTKHKLPFIYLEPDSLDFSFSGLKASCRRLIEQQDLITDEFINDLCAIFEYTVGKIFQKKISRVLERYPDIKQVSFVGGVSANRYLNQVLSEFLEAHNKDLITPKQIEFCTDNASMIASAAYFKYQANPDAAKIQFVEASSRLEMSF